MNAIGEVATAARLGIMPCRCCRLVYQGTDAADPRCPRCGAPLGARHFDSLGRTTALLIAAAILYVPANVLPVMRTTTFFQVQDDTIVSGILFLLASGSWPLAVLVFFASVVVPIGKFLSLGLLLVASWRRTPWRRGERTRLYRIVEFVGRWSMLDIFVITALAALARAEPLAAVEAGPAALAFAAVVVLMMLATMSFDPRTIWQTEEARLG